MKNDLRAEHLNQEVTVVLPLGVVLRITEDPRPAVAPVPARFGSLPAIGAQCENGIYAGLSVEGEQAVALVLLPGEETASWSDAIAWAEKQGGTLPSRIDQLVLFKNVKSEFKDAWYWSGEQYAGDESYAWYQLFGNGTQDGGREGYAAGLRAVQPIADRLGTLSAGITETIEAFQQDLRRLAATAPKAAPQPSIAAVRAAPSKAGVGRGVAAAAAVGPGEVDKAMPRAILTALAQHPEGLTKGQVLVHTGYRSSGPVSGCFAELARNGWIETRRDKVAITAEGLKALGAYEPLPTGDALREHLLNGSKLSTMEKAMLRVLFGAYPEVLAKGRILETTGYASSGPVSGAFARLVALGYARPAGRGALVAAAELFNG